MTRIISDEDRIELNALVDGELEATEAATLSARITADPALRSTYEAIAATREAVSGLPRPEVSDDFRRRIEGIAGGESRAVAPGKKSWLRLEGWQSIAALLVVAVISGAGAHFVTASRSPSPETLLAAAHRRSLLAASPVDVLSADRHTVKPWLDARIGVSPPAPDLAGQGYALVGGRVDVLGQQALPTLVYRHNEHMISVAAFPGGAAKASPRDLALAGYNMVKWSGDGFDFIAISDLEAGELATFVKDYRLATAGTGKG